LLSRRLHGVESRVVIDTRNHSILVGHQWISHGVDAHALRSRSAGRSFASLDSLAIFFGHE
jgi:hypothetical protein